MHFKQVQAFLKSGCAGSSGVNVPEGFGDCCRARVGSVGRHPVRRRETQWPGACPPRGLGTRTWPSRKDASWKKYVLQTLWDPGFQSELPQFQVTGGEGQEYGQLCGEPVRVWHSEPSDTLQAGPGGGVAATRQLLKGTEQGHLRFCVNKSGKNQGNETHYWELICIHRTMKLAHSVPLYMKT